MEQPPDPRVTGSFPTAGKAEPGRIPQQPGSAANEPTARLIPSYTGKIPTPQTPGLGTGKIPIFAYTGKVPVPQASRPPADGATILPGATSTRMPVVIPPDKKKRPGSEPTPAVPRSSKSSRGLDKRISWYVVSIAGILTIILGFVFTVPLNTGQQASTTVAQGIANLIQTGSFSAQPQRQAQGPGKSQPQAATGYPAPGSGNVQLFKRTSPWNTPIGSNVQLDPNSSNWASELSNCCHVPAMFGYGMPIYTSTASDPLYTVDDTGGDSLFSANQPIHIPNNAAPSPGTDKWLFIFDKTKNLIFEMWNTSKDGNTWTTETGDVYSPTGDGVLQINGSQQGGNGASYFGGVVTNADIQRGYINHALSFASQLTGSSWRYPMNASDGHDGDIPMGARVQLDPAVNCNTLSGASRGEKMVCQALETYGGYMRDTGGVTLSMYFEGEDLNDPSRNPPNGSPGDAGRTGGVFGRAGLHDGQDLAAIPWGKLRVLKSWNSYADINTPRTPAPLLQIQTPAAPSTFLQAVPAFPGMRPTLLGDTTRTRRWLVGKQATLATFPSNQFYLLCARLLPLEHRQC